MQTIQMFSQRHASLIGTRRRYTTYLVTFDVIFVMFDVINQATDKTIARCFSITFIWWRHKCGVVDSMDRLVTSYERRYMYVAAARAN